MLYVCLDLDQNHHMLDPWFPAEITDSIIDLLHDKLGALRQCSLVSKSWVPCSRKHLFSRIVFRRPADVNTWKELFPDPANSPGYHTHSLFIDCVEVFTVADAEEGGWVQAFSNVVRLRVWNSDDTIVSSSNFLALICSLPVLENLDLGFLEPRGSDDVDITIFQPSTSPPLTGTLSLSLVQAKDIRCPILRLIDLPIRFRRLEYEWWSEDDLPWIRGLIAACSDTLESLLVGDNTSEHSWEASIDLSKATKLKEVTFRFQDLAVAWAASTLKTITSKHMDLREVSIKGRALSDPTDWPTNAAAVGDDTRTQWVYLERIIIQLWESHSVRTKVKYYSTRREESNELMSDLLPEATRKGVVELELVDISTVY